MTAPTGVRRHANAVARSAAFLVLGGGLADLLSVMAPRLEPMTIFIVVTAFVTWLDGALLGAFTAAAGVATCALLFTPAAERFGRLTWIHAAAAAAVVVVISIARTFLRRRQPEPVPLPVRPQLLHGSDFGVSPQKADREVIEAIQALRGDLAVAFAELDRTREDAAGRVSHLLADIEAARGETKKLQEERAAWESRFAAATAHAEELQHAVDHATRQREEQLAAIHERDARLDELTRAVTLWQQRAEKFARHRESDVAASREHESRANALSTAKEELQRAFDELTQRHAQLTGQHDVAASRIAEQAAAATALERRVIQLDGQIRDLETQSRDREARALELEGLSREREARILELEGQLGEVEGDLVEARTDVATAEKLRARVVELEEEMADASVALEQSAVRERAAAARAREATAIIENLQREQAAAVAHHEAARNAAMAERTELAARVAALESQLNAGTAESKAALLSLDAERREAVASADALRMQLAEAREERTHLEQSLTDLRNALAEAAVAAEGQRSESSNRAEEVAELQSEAEALRTRLGVVEAQLAAALRERNELRSTIEAAGRESSSRIASLETRLTDAISRADAADLLEAERTELLQRTAALETQFDAMHQDRTFLVNQAARIDSEASVRVTAMQAELAIAEAARIASAAQVETLQTQLAALQETHSTQLTALQAAHVTQLADVETTHVRKLAEVQATHVTQLAEVQTTHAKQLADVQETQATQLKALQASNATQLADVESTRVRQLAEVQAAHAAQLAEERQAQDARIAELESTVAEARRERDSLQEALTTARQQSDERVQRLEAKLADADRSRGSLERLQIVELQAQLVDIKRVAALATDERQRAEATRRKAESEAQESAAKLAELEAALAAERALREQQDVAHNENLQKIVTHLAMDHEADLGQAMEEKSAARAEVRSLTMRMSALQKAVDEERAHFAATQEKWNAARQAMQARVEETDTRARQAVEDSAGLLARMRATAQGEIDALRARVIDLQREVMRRTPPSTDTKPGVPSPPHEATGFAIVATPELTPVTARIRVLVAHPDADLRTAAKTNLERLGYEVETAADGLEALRLAIARQPDVLVADAAMPKMDGRELCQLLKSQERTAAIKFLLLARDEEVPSSSRELQPDGVLRKPVKFDTLRAALEAQVARER